MKKNLLISLFLFFAFSCIQAQAQETTQAEASQSGTIVIEKKSNLTAHDQASADQILDNLERLAKDPDASQQIQNQYDDVSNKNRGFIAQVSSFKDGALKLITLNQEEIFVTPDKSTTVIKKGKSATGENLELGDWFAIDDWLVLIGVQNNDLFAPRRIIISSESLAPTVPFVTRGQIKTVTSKKVDVALIGGANEVETFNLSKTVNLVDQNNETLTYKDLTVGAQVLLVGTITDDKKSLQTLRLI